MQKPGSYDDIIHLPHHTSKTRPRMPVIDRAAQFSPFAALTGYDAVIQETARLTDRPAELDESRKAILNEKLQLLLETAAELPEAAITYFAPDSRKDGGAYVRAVGRVAKVDAVRGVVVLADGTSIEFSQIYEIESGSFRDPD